MPLNRRDLFLLPLSRLSGADDEPGLLVSRPGAAPPRVTVLAYSALEITECAVDDLGLLAHMRGKWPVVWVDVGGVDHAPTLLRVGEIFGLHPPALESLGDPTQRPRAEAYGDRLLFAGVPMARLDPALDLEPVGLFLGPDFVVTVQPRGGDSLESVRQRIRQARGPLRHAGPDHLLAAVIDALVDHGLPVAEAYADRMGALEREVVSRPTRATPARLHAARRELAVLHRAAEPLRDALAALAREPLPLVSPEARVSLRGTADHGQQLLDQVDAARELGASLADLYLASLGRRATGIMRVVAVLAAVFLPLGLVAGIHGMDVPHPPGAWWWGLPFALGAMAAAAVLAMGRIVRRGLRDDP